MKKFCWIAAVGLLFFGCDSVVEQSPNEISQSSSRKVQDSSNYLANEQDLQQSDEASPDEDELSILFIGNSHSAPIPKRLTEIYQRQQPGAKVRIKAVRKGGFLVDHARSESTLQMMRSGDWDWIVLQAQKYSTTGRYTYPTTGAIELSEVAAEVGAKVIMYPEWSRRDVPEEYARIRAIHDSIAEETGADVAPIGEAWEKAISENTDGLYARDGNHATAKGSYLNAAVFYSLIEKESPVFEGQARSEDERIKRKLERYAWESVEEAMQKQSTEPSPENEFDR